MKVNTICQMTPFIPFFKQATPPRQKTKGKQHICRAPLSKVKVFLEEGRGHVPCFTPIDASFVKPPELGQNQPEEPAEVCWYGQDRSISTGVCLNFTPTRKV